MITLQRVRHRKAGFTLVEILIALAIFSVAATGLMALFPIADGNVRKLSPVPDIGQSTSGPL